MNPAACFASVTIGIVILLGCGDDGASPDGGARDGALSDGSSGDSSALDGDVTDGNLVDAAVVDDGFSPVLSNFRVTNEQPDRLYFDSSKAILATTFDGFTISGETISAVVVAMGARSGHYFRISDAFDFWDNNTIRYEGGSDLKDTMGRALYPFTLTYVENEIPDPPAGTNRYVSASAAGGGDGTSEASPWTLTQAFSRATAGTTVWVETGDYGARQFTTGNAGTATSPIRIIGYRTTIDDIADAVVDGFEYMNTAQANRVFDAARYPVLTGTLTDTAGINIVDDFWIVKNFQIRNHRRGVWVYDAAFVVLDNITTANSYQNVDLNSGQGILSGNTVNHHVRVTRCLSFDNGVDNIWLFGNFNLVEGCKTYSGVTGLLATDYYVVFFRASSSIMVANLAERVGDISHRGHAFGIKVAGDHTLIANNVAINIAENIYFAHNPVEFNVAKHNRIVGDPSIGWIGNALVVRDGASSNIFELNEGTNLKNAIHFSDSPEWETETPASFPTAGNVFRNNVFPSTDAAITSVRDGVSTPDRPLRDNQIYNNLIGGIGSRYARRSLLYNQSLATSAITNNEIVNNIFVDFPNYSRGDDTGLSYLVDNNIFHQCPFAAPAGNMEIDPLFVDAAAEDFHLQPTSPARDIGLALEGVNYDADSVERFPDRASIGPYERD